MSAAPGTHIGAGRAGFGGMFNLRAISTGDQRDIGFAWDYFFARVTLYQGDGGRWYAQPPAGCG
ncbi:hypothetical protein A8M77_04830 [Variovorax sp. JS1663]|nr:hypothetical protein A8M77_04830 [Variovorax sp. JS1663]